MAVGVDLSPPRERGQERSFHAPRGPGQVRSRTSTPRVSDFRTVSDLPSLPTGRPARPSMPTGPPPVRAAVSPPDGPTGLPPADALSMVDEAAVRLWEPSGSEALAYLRGRGLTPESIRQARLGWADKIRLPKRDGIGTWTLSGITVPWHDGHRLARVKVRRLGLSKGARYIEAFASGPRVYPGPEAIRPGTPLIIVEGEFDCMLMQQEVEHLASVATFGSASSRPDPSLWLTIARCSEVFVALDGDDAGDRAAAEWGGRSIRVRPPVGQRLGGSLCERVLPAFPTSGVAS